MEPACLIMGMQHVGVYPSQLEHMVAFLGIECAAIISAI